MILFFCFRLKTKKLENKSGVRKQEEISINTSDKKWNSLEQNEDNDEDLDFFEILNNDLSIQFFQNKDTHTYQEHQLNMGISSHKCEKFTLNFKKFDTIIPEKLQYLADMKKHRNWFKPIKHYEKYNNNMTMSNMQSKFTPSEEFYIEN